MRISDWSSDVCSSDLYTPRELEAQVEDSGTDLLVTVSAAALLPTALAALDGSSLKQLVVGSVAGGLPAAKSLLYRLFRRGEVAALPDDPRHTRLPALIPNHGRHHPAALEPDTELRQHPHPTGNTS